MNELTFNNNWENYEFWYDDNLIKNITGIFINGDYFTVIRQNVYNTVSDHGHSYNVSSKTYKVLANIADCPVEIDLRDFIGRAGIFIQDSDIEYKGS